MNTKEQIEAILSREILKIEVLSLTCIEPLSVSAIKSLDVLIKSYRSLVDPKPAEPAPASTTASIPADQLIKAILGDQAEG